MVTAAKFNERIQIQIQTKIDDDVGQQIPVWSKYDEVWAGILFENGKERIASGRDTSESMASVRIRYRKDITSSMRILWGDIIFNIQAVLPDVNKREFVDLAVSTGVNNG